MVIACLRCDFLLQENDNYNTSVLTEIMWLSGATCFFKVSCMNQEKRQVNAKSWNIQVKNENLGIYLAQSFLYLTYLIIELQSF